MNNRYEIDITKGPMIGKILLFTLPLIFSGLLQLLFNAADTVIVGRFAENGNTALAAVGSSGPLISLIINLFLGLSTGATVIVSRYYGARDHAAVERAVHTAITISAICGVLVGIFGFTCSATFLRWMDAPESVLPAATLYMRIYFCGLPVNMLYNFGSAILRAVGDTRRPLLYLSLAGVINVLMNLIFVIVFHLDVAGVALATVISQAVSCILVLRCLMISGGNVKLTLKKLRIYKNELFQIAKIGLTAGFQSVLFCLSTVLIQSSVNSFGETIMAGNTAAGNLEGFVYISMNAFSHTATNFISQNVGAKDLGRARRLLFICAAMVIVLGIALGLSVYFAGEILLGIYRPGEAEIIAAGMIRLFYFCIPYCICGIMDLFSGALRGLGFSFLPMIISLVGVCGIRILWIYTAFQWHRTIGTLYISYPITWVITAIAEGICLILVFRRMKKSMASDMQ